MKKVRFLASLILCLTMGMSATACDWFPTEDPDNGGTQTEQPGGDEGTEGEGGSEGTEGEGEGEQGGTEGEGGSEGGNEGENEGTEGGDVTDNEVGPKATVKTWTADELATVNSTGVALYDLTTFQTTGATATLETAYTFSVTETAEEVIAGEYANWIADYYVSVDQTVAAGAIGLAGSYDAWANGEWVAFYSPIEVVANTPMGLLESTGGTPWTYLDVVRIVDTFRCGAFDLNNACSGVKLTVELRLTNPENAEEKITICVTEYTFA